METRRLLQVSEGRCGISLWRWSDGWTLPGVGGQNPMQEDSLTSEPAPSDFGLHAARTALRLGFRHILKALFNKVSV